MMAFNWTLGSLIVLVKVFFALANECYYEVARTRTGSLVGTMTCEHGCCGTTENRSCCDEHGNTIRIIVYVLCSVFVLVAIVTVVYYCIKKKNKKRMRVNNNGCTAAQSTSPNQNIGLADMSMLPPQYYECRPAAPQGSAREEIDSSQNGPVPIYVP